MDGYVLILSDDTPSVTTRNNEVFATALACQLVRSHNCDVSVYELPSMRLVRTYTHEAPNPERGNP